MSAVAHVSFLVLRQLRSPKVSFGQPRSPKLGPKRGYSKVGTFVEREKWDFSSDGINKKESENLLKHPPKWWSRHLFHAFSDEYYADFEKLHIFDSF